VRKNVRKSDPEPENENEEHKQSNKKPDLAHDIPKFVTLGDMFDKLYKDATDAEEDLSHTGEKCKKVIARFVN
jgi:hypothetical protein